MYTCKPYDLFLRTDFFVGCYTIINLRNDKYRVRVNYASLNMYCIKLS